MDPMANLMDQLETAKYILKTWDNCTEDGELTYAQQVDVANKANELAELVIALDEWISTGGFLPRKWSGRLGSRQAARDATK
jgi:hypothetical protein